MSEQIAVIADIHGNTWALDAVLQDIQRRGIATTVNLGDCVYGSLDPAGTLERLMSADILSIAGNQDREVFDESEQVRSSRDHQFVTGELSAAQLDWLDRLPPTQIVGELFLCHGTPSSNMIYLLERVTEHGVFLNSTADIQAQLRGIRQQVVVCGHSHVARTVWLPDGRLVVNPGSVGIPAYDEDVPFPHIIGGGQPARALRRSHTADRRLGGRAGGAALRVGRSGGGGAAKRSRGSRALDRDRAGANLNTE